MNGFVKPLCVILMALTAPAWADISRDDAAAVAQRQGQGRVLSVEKSDAGGRVVWRVKLLTAQGEVRVVLVDAASGQLR